ncbi:phosphonate ABC transporter ATP-binding protein [Humisphaera borealis]|uniref:Phosphonate ABC transporter ATP-binding protein n=1 Tax=Humisphaera borealis TaxID=2807512 RepID=A0A7M2WUM2_9BACT|nr:phosphonate ABC transporter ATP-binding protein [Humisphaera borealis]QOV89218.1 phosphonate ABC transporter ATP-binding protein [Humisphaera borealis]
MVTFRNITKTFPGGTRAIDNVSLSVPPGQFCVILGSSGAGKSTLLRAVNGLTELQAGVDVGEVRVGDTTVSPRTLRDVRRRVGMVHQQFNLVARLTVMDNVLAGALPEVSLPRTLLRLFPRDLRRKACVLLAEVGLGEEHLYRKASKLSGGQQQRVAIARALMLDPPVLLADEPVASLDPQTSSSILELLRHSTRSRGTTVLCSLHQVDLAIKFADRIVAMKNGKVVFDGPPEVLAALGVDSIYGGELLASPPPAPSSDETGGNNPRSSALTPQMAIP